MTQQLFDTQGNPISVGLGGVQTRLNQPLTGDPNQSGALGSNQFNPSLASVTTTEQINEAMSAPTVLPPDAQRSLDIGEIGRVPGQPTVFLRTGQDELRGFI